MRQSLFCLIFRKILFCCFFMMSKQPFDLSYLKTHSTTRLSCCQCLIGNGFVSQLEREFFLTLVRMTGLVVSKANVIAKRANLFATVKRQLHKGRLQTKFADDAICIVASPSPQYKEKRTPMVRFILVWCG